MELYLVRHGKTRANEQRLYCGQTDLPLSPEGAAEITLLKSRGIYPVPADLFFTSGLCRTDQTLDIIYGPVQRTALPLLAEYNFGEYEMRGHEELLDREDYRLWIADETGTVLCPGGESRKQFEERVIEGYNRIMNEVRLTGSGSAFAACHGGTIARVMEYLRPDTRDFYGWQPVPGRGYTLLFSGEKLQGLRNL